MNEASPIRIDPPETMESAFIPLSRDDVIKGLASEELWSNPEERANVYSVLNLIGMIRQHHSAETLNRLTDLYDPFNPDDETVNLVEAQEMERLEKRRIFNSKLKELVTSANFQEIGSEEMDEIFEKASPDGVHVEVDFDEYELCLMFHRGESTVEKKKRDIMKLYLKHKTYRVDVYDRLFVALKFKPEEQRITELQRDGLDEKAARKKLTKLRKMLPPAFSTDHIYVKIFKSIPKYDVEMLFPNLRVKMKYRDKLQLGGSALLGTLTWAVGTASKLLVAVALSPIVLAGTLLTGVGGIMYAQIRNIFVTRDRYRMQLAQSLYFQNIANNQAALALMVDEAEEEDVKEEALLYVHLCQWPVHESQLENLRIRIDGFLFKNFQIDVKFDIRDALDRLMARGLVTQSPTGELQAMPPQEAVPFLKTAWARLASVH
ncbi:MAG: DUF3754 domain-containing protein [Hyphomicrobiales bacterium]|nr:DUF3754 domain-containing protein [Hyphomicrobiales bacterium]